MIDIIDMAVETGRSEGLETGRFLNAREFLIDAIIDRFNILPIHVSQHIQKIQDSDVLRALFRQVFKCKDVKEFEMALNQL